MSTLFYKDYTITPGAVRDEISGKYAPTVHIAWHEAEGKSDSNSFTLAERCSTFRDASGIALERAKAWADRRLTPFEPVASRTVALDVIDGRAFKPQ